MRVLLFGIAALFCWLSTGVLAVDSAKQSNQHGYWWGEKSVIADDPDVEDKYPPPPPNPQFEDLMTKHPREIKALEEQYREYAVWQRTPEAPRDYWTVVDAARRVARSFTALTAVTMLSHPELNARAQNPITNAGREAKRRIRDDEVNQILAGAGKEFALVMFSQPGCQYCQLQRNALGFFTDKHGWPYREVDIIQQPGIAQRFNVTMTPVTILIKKGTDKWMNIAVGAESIPSIEDNAYRAVRLLKGQITPSQFYTPESVEGGFFDPQVGSKK
jgi:conjugal transfer pilus assembly protein TraF